MLKLIYAEIAKRDRPLSAVDIVILNDRKSDRVLEYVNIPVDIRLDMLSDITVEEKCAILRKYLENIDINAAEWNDNFDFSEWPCMTKWVEVKR